MKNKKTGLLLMALLLIGILIWVGMQVWGKQHPEIEINIGRPVEPVEDQYMENCVFSARERSIFGTTGKMVRQMEEMYRGYDALLKKMLETYENPKHLEVVIQTQGDQTYIGYLGYATTHEGERVEVSEGSWYECRITRVN